MQMKSVIEIVALILIVGGIVWYAVSHPIGKQTEAPMATSTPAAAPTVTGPRVEHAPYYDLSVAYPSKTTLSASANRAALTLMREYLDTVTAQFKADGNFSNLSPEDVTMMGFDQGRKQALDVTYRTASSPRTTSYIFTIYQDTLGAHGNTFFRTFTFDTSTGALLSLADIFLPNTPYLTTLSALSRAKLPATIGEFADTNFINGGTIPEQTSFEHFYFDKNDFVILFDPYAVAPYAAGPQTLRIPLTELSNILKPEYR